MTPLNEHIQHGEMYMHVEHLFRYQEADLDIQRASNTQLQETKHNKQGKKGKKSQSSLFNGILLLLLQLQIVIIIIIIINIFKALRLRPFTSPSQ